jgi:hypothetical protein
MQESSIMESIKLNFGVLIAYLSRAILQRQSPRKASNATRYSLSDAVLGAFSVFFTQSDSFLKHQRQMESHQGKNNAQTLFGMIQIPSVPLIALDGTEYFNSQKLHCESCSSRTHKNGSVTYFHGAILPVIVAPEQSQVISLAPEFITPQDGHEKQDCEVAAAKRWVATHALSFVGQPVTLLGDDLYSHQPMCEAILAAGMNFIFTCLPNSHTALYDWLTYLEEIGEVQTLQVKPWNKNSREVYRYR